MGWGEALGRPREWARGLAIATGLGMLLGVLGPFGSFEGGGLEMRLFYWTANLWIGFAMLSVGARLSLWVGDRIDLPVWFSLPAGVALVAVPLCFVVGLFSARFWPGMHGRFPPLLQVYGETLAIAEPCSLLFYWVGTRHPHAAPAPPAPAGAPASSVSFAGLPAGASGEGRFRERLSGRVGGALLCLQMEDHYVRAHTARGSELILLPLRDAIAELGEAEGLQVHRSWWVARAAVAEVVRDGRNLRLRLTNGLEAPVSRASMGVLRSAGWLAGTTAEVAGED